MNLKEEQRKVMRAGIAALVACAGVLAACYVALPRLMSFPVDLAERLAFTLRADLFVMVWVFIAMRMVSSGRLKSEADIKGSAFGPPSPAIAVKTAFLQNTLEQAFMAIGVHLVLATLLQGGALSLIFGAVALFAIGRVAFYRGYLKGAGGRAFGMVVTALPTLAGFILATALMLAR